MEDDFVITSSNNTNMTTNVKNNSFNIILDKKPKKTIQNNRYIIKSFSEHETSENNRTITNKVLLENHSARSSVKNQKIPSFYSNESLFGKNKLFEFSPGQTVNYFDKKFHEDKSNIIIIPEHDLSAPNILRNNHSLNYCKICHDNKESDDNKLIHPCICIGNMRLVHENCLKILIMKNKDSPLEKANCEVCKFPYKMNIAYNKKFSRKNCCKFAEKIIMLSCLGFVIIFLILGLFYLSLPK